MKKLICVLLLLTLCLSLFACHRPLPGYTPTQSPTQKPAPAPTEPPVPFTEPTETQAYIPSIDECIGLYTYENISYSDGFNDYDADFFIPEILLDSDDAENANIYIQSVCMDALEDSRAARDEGYSMICSGIDYDAWEYENYLSLVVHIPNDWGCDHYMVFTFDLLTGRRLDNADFAAYVGKSESELKESVKVTLLDAYDANYGQVPAEMKDDFYNQQRENTGSDFNVDACELYIGADGSLFIHCNLYSIAGADCYEYLIPLTFG